MIHTLDLNFIDESHLIASYLLRDGEDVVLVESGPGSTLPALEKGLRAQGLQLGDVTHVLLTHVHLDHAGAAGFVAQHGAKVYVHENGARHLLDPARLWASATRVYGEQLMATLWGEMLPIPEEQVFVLKDGDTVQAAGRTFTALDTPGHAYHHLAYLTDEGDCFTGDVGACALPGYSHVRVPTPPPDLDIPAWDKSLRRLIDIAPERLHLTHFGAVENSLEHLHKTLDELHALTDWMKTHWEAGTSRSDVLTDYFARMQAKAEADGVDEEGLYKFELTAGADGCVGGYRRYFRKLQEQENAS